MASLNSYDFTGRLGRDPELRTTQSGRSVCGLTVAVDTYGDRPTLWVDVSVWGDQGENCAKWLAKGREVAIHGQVDEVAAYKRRDGDLGASLRVTAREVAFIGGRGDAPEGGFTPRTDTPTAAPADEDDIPF